MRRMEPVVCLSLYYKSSSDLLKTNQASRETQLIAKILWPVLLVPTFTSNNSVLNFWTKFTSKDISCLKPKKKKKISINVRFFMFEFIQISDFKLNRQFYFFGQNFPKQSIFCLKQKKRSSATNSVYSISSFRTNFQIKKATLIF